MSEALQNYYDTHPRKWQGDYVGRVDFKPAGVQENCCLWCGKLRTGKRPGDFCAGTNRNSWGHLRYPCADAFLKWLWQRPGWQRLIMTRDLWKCQSCGLTPTWKNEHGLIFPDMTSLHVDHIHPVSKGGKTVADNLQTLCKRCNLSKGAKIATTAKMNLYLPANTQEVSH